ncbi:phosphatidylglycerophosphatase A family protein [Chitinibacter tainanensis]|uniref:phosphatidylglycerophosphatase A family protein n=1 Tax=Chitinibacter tainanensis TaxID=230667 RepID=UPI00041FF736|nr:phosphatidylglycerophosphatase A [Chitinibacter tainanensis]
MTQDKKQPPLLTPDWAFLMRHPAHWLAFGFGAGLARRAPGTWGTLVALPLFALLHIWLPAPIIFALCWPLFAAGIWFCEVTGRALGVSDYGGIVWDEIVAMLMVLCFAPESWLGWLMAFALFRLFDIVKPWPIRWCDHQIKGGLGVMVDDILAAAMAIAVLLVIGPWIS